MTLIQSSPSQLRSTRGNVRTVGKPFQAVMVMLAVTLFLMGGIGGRLAYLQLIEGQHNRQLADNNRIRLIPRQPERGRILDRKGRTLAGSRLSYAVFLWPIANREQEWQPVLRRLSKILNIPEKTVLDRLDQAGYTSPFLVRIARGLSPAQVTALAEFSQELPGVQVEAEAVRYYPNGDLAAHVLGYTGELSDAQLERKASEGYRLGDVIGQMGVEAAFERQLRGEWGGQQVEVDGMGNVIQVLGEKPARAGRDVQLTLDLDLQRSAEAALGNRKGAVVAIDPRDGSVLAMVSRPTFDPNLFSTRITDAQWKQLQSQDYPFVNRALQGYAPASTFKVVTLTAGLESGRFSPSSYLPTRPYLEFGGIRFAEWNRAGFGTLGFVGAMSLSSNTFFGQVGIRTGDRTLIQWARRYGFGSKTGIELANEEAPGLVPDEKWKLETLNEPWYIGDTINMSIGQGYMQASPLQVAVMFAVAANGGYRVTPHLLNQSNVKRESLNLSASTLETLRAGLRGVITQGTGKALNIPSLPPNAGKTGTAEDPPRKSHAWYGGFAPFDNPEIVVVAFVENSAAGGGGKVAAPIVRQVMDTYFNGTRATGVAGHDAVNSD